MQPRRLLWLVVLCCCGRSDDSPMSAEGASASGSDVGSSPVQPTEGDTTGSATHGMSGQGPGSGDPTGGDGSAEGETAGEPDAPVIELSDEFDDPATLQHWLRRDEVEGGASSIETLEIADGRLRMRPVAGGWYDDYVGAMLFKSVSGNFVVETHVTAVSRNDPEAPPGLPFNSGGLIVRDPDSTAGRQNWIAHNVGFQSASVATEGKTTIDSRSELFLVDGIHHGRLRLCRWGDTFILTRQLDGESTFTETQRFERPDLEGELQIGMMANGWNSIGSDPDTSRAPDVDVSFDYIRFSRPDDADGCLSPG